MCRYYVSFLALLVLVLWPVWAQAAEGRGAFAAPTTDPADVIVRRKLALVVGTDHYTDPAWGQLANAGRDAEAIAKLLHDRFEYDVVLLTDPKLGDVHRAMLSLKTKAGKDDDVVVFVAGHGWYDRGGTNKGYLIFNDSPGPEGCFAGCLDMSNLRTALEDTAAAHVLVIIDACHGGAIHEKVALGLWRGGGEGALSEKLADVRRLRGYGRYGSRLVLTSGGNNRVDDGGAGGHSPFATRVLDVLSQSSEGNVVGVEQLVAAVSDLATGPTYGPFEPSVRHQGGTFLFWHGADRGKIGTGVEEPDGGSFVRFRREEPTFVIAKWVTLAGGALLIGAGSYFLIDGTDDWDRIDDERDTLTKSEGRELVESGRDKRTVGYVLGGVSVAALGVSLAMFLLDASESEPAPAFTFQFDGRGAYGAWSVGF